MIFNLDETYVYTNVIHKSKTRKHKPVNLATMNLLKNINIIRNREENHLNIPDSYLEIDFYVTLKNSGARFAKCDNNRLVIYGLV